MKILKRLIFLLPGIMLASFTVAGTEEIKVIKYPELLEIIQSSEQDEIRVINFWATWCAPCIKELPYFENVREKYQQEGVRVILVSLDDIAQLNTSVTKMAERKNLQSELYLLDETDFNAFIDKVDERWSGVLPATLIINSRTSERVFFNNAVEQQALEEAINKLM